MNRSESTTLLMSTVLAVSGWIATHVADRITATPLLEYSVHQQNAEVVLELENLNRTIAYKNVRVIVTPAAHRTIATISIAPREPAFEGDDQPTTSGTSASFTIPTLAPRAMIRAHFATNDRPSLRIYSDDQPILLIEPGLETLLARNEIAILLLILPTILGIVGITWTGRRLLPTRPSKFSTLEPVPEDDVPPALPTLLNAAGRNEA